MGRLGTKDMWSHSITMHLVQLQDCLAPLGNCPLSFYIVLTDKKIKKCEKTYCVYIKKTTISNDILDYEHVHVWLKFLVAHNKYYCSEPDNPYGPVEVDWAELESNIRKRGPIALLVMKFLGSVWDYVDRKVLES